MAAAPLALDKQHRGLRLRDANRPLTSSNKQRVVGLEVTPDKAPTLRGARPAPAVGFYAWATPHKKQQPRTRAISHPALREPISKATPLSQAVRAATARRDASIGDAYRAKHAASRSVHKSSNLAALHFRGTDSLVELRTGCGGKTDYLICGSTRPNWASRSASGGGPWTRGAGRHVDAF